MKIILLKDVKKLGNKDDILEVKDGYGKFLINNKDAVMYSTKSKEVLNKEITLRQLEEEKLIKDCENIKKQLEKEVLVFKVKIGSNGKLFGTISTKQIHDQLVKFGYKVDKKKINLKTEINTIGFYEAQIVLHNKVKAKIKIEIKSE